MIFFKQNRNILLFIALFIAVFVIMRTAWILRRMTPDPSQTLSTPQWTPYQPISASSGAGADITDAFLLFWNQYQNHREELDPDDFAPWFNEWSQSQQGRYVEWNTVYRGTLPSTHGDTGSSGSVYLIFRPVNKSIRHLARIKCLVNKGRTEVESLFLDDEVIVKGSITSITGETRQLGIETLPFGANLTVSLENVEIVFEHKG